MVSIIIPNYNHATYLKSRIDSVLNQTFQDFELIILDDYSKDNSREIIEQYRYHPKVSLINYNESNSGSTFKQWNKGVDLAKGDLIWIAESDDLAEPEFLSTLVKMLEQNNQVGLAYANSYVIDADDKVLRTYSQEYANWSDRWQRDFINKGFDEVVSFLQFAPVILNVSSCIFRKSVFLMAGGCDEDFKLAGDWFTYVKMLEHADIAYCALPLNYFRTHSQTVRNNSKHFVHFFENIKVISYIYKHFNVPKSQKNIQAYNFIAQFHRLATNLTAEQKKIILSYLRSNFMKYIDILRWKYEAALIVKRIIKP